jgi:hypothetical protein
MKTLLSIALVFALSATYAQRVIGVHGGVNINNISNTSRGPENYSSLQSFHVGVMGNLPFTIFSFQPGIQVTGKGGIVTYGDPNSTGDYFVAESNPFYLEVPATFNLNLRFSDFAGMYIGAGPYASIGIGGMNRVHGRREGTEFGYNEKISFDQVKQTPAEEGGAYSSYNKYDYGARVNAGLFLTRLHLGVFYDQGLSKFNRISNPGHNDALRLGTLGFTAGFVFGG